jgi:hypothetical protein
MKAVRVLLGKQKVREQHPLVVEVKANSAAFPSQTLRNDHHRDCRETTMSLESFQEYLQNVTDDNPTFQVARIRQIDLHHHR